MIGDLINFSPCLKIIKENNKNFHITLICSDYNFQVAKNYPYVDEFIIFKKKNLFINIFKNFGKLFLIKYKYLFQFDGKSSSYFISYLVRSKIKSTICFIKNKKFFGLNFYISRPSKYLLKAFYDNFIFCDENYTDNQNNKSSIHYQTNYLNILKKLDFNITHKKSLFYLDKAYEKFYDKFFYQYINGKYLLFHFDERWDKYKTVDYENSLKIINEFSKKNKVIITTGIKDFIFLKDLNKKFIVFNFKDNEFAQNNKVNINNVMLIKNIELNLLAYFIKNSELSLSAHSGPIVHISASFDRPIIDLLPKSKNNEMDRWVPENSKYKRINFEDINDKLIENLQSP